MVHYCKNNERIFKVFAENEIQQKMSLIFKELKDVRGLVRKYVKSAYILVLYVPL
jgi:hypothetical protein